MKKQILFITSMILISSCGILGSEAEDIGLAITDQTGNVINTWGIQTEKTSHDGFTLEYPYPNPSLGAVTFSFSFNSWRDNPQSSKITISTLSGRVIHTEDIAVEGRDCMEYVYNFTDPGIYKVRMYTITHYVAHFTNDLRRDESKSLDEKLDYLRNISN